VRHVVEELGVSQRSACRALGQPRSTQRYGAQRRNGDEELRRQMRELALRNPRYGYRRIAVLLAREGWHVNGKRVLRLWRDEGLKVQKRQVKRGRIVGGSSDNACHRWRAERINHVWSFDFCHDRTSDGKPLKIFSVIDEYTRRCLHAEARRRITGVDVVRMLDALTATYGVPEHLRCDNGPEFVCSALKTWAGRAAVSTLYVAPGSPWENAYAESYHARLRDELLDREEFGSLAEARVLLEDWRGQYNQERPHSALGYKTPAEFAAACAGAGRAEPCSATLRGARHDEEKVPESVAQ
jgi:transposase InsO family protein